MAGTIFVDTDNLPGVITNIQNIQGAIDTYKSTISGLSAQLDLYLSGTATIVGTVEGAFATTMSNLSAADTSLSTLAGQLQNALNDALAAIGAL